MIQKNVSLLIVIAGILVVMFSEGKPRGLLFAGGWLLTVGFVLMFRKILRGK